jgi:mannan endo-1,4-beta-mannosidase
MANKKYLPAGQIAAIIFFLCVSIACAEPNDDNNGNEKTIAFVSSDPADGAKEISPLATTEIVLTYDRNIIIATPHGITLNGKAVTTKVSVSGKDLKIAVQLEGETTYQLIVPAKAVQARDEVLWAGEVKISFQTKKETFIEPSALVVQNPSREAVNLYHFLLENYGKKIISGTMANVHWNTNEADWVYKHTGKYPALNGFDYMHKDQGIDYTKTAVVENWWSNNGIVTACWHWYVPRTQGSSQTAFYTKKGEHASDGTDFDIREAVKEGTPENAIVKKDLEDVANYLLLLKNKNIPVLWRPLHEAAGTWFWWGAKGAEPCKALWKMMFNYFQERGLNHLIWIWTAEPNDIVNGQNVWYPGDEYVDIIGRDIYNQTSASSILSEYNKLKTLYPNKMITLSEFGNVAGVTDYWNAGAKWSWMMPWYNYVRTNNPNGSEFNSQEHEYANILYWNSAFGNPNVISRDQMPSLK